MTPDGKIADGNYTAVKVPALDGYMGILANHAPIAAVVTTGIITLTKPDNSQKEFFVSKGFLEVAENCVKILAEECMPTNKLDAEKSWDILQEAYKMPRDTKAQEASREEAIHAARTRFSIAQKARKSTRNLDDILKSGL